MKILFLSHSFYPAIGGIETVSELLADAFHSAGIQVHLVTWTKEKGEKKFSFPVTRNPGLFQLIRQHAEADLVFENNPCLRLSWPSLFISRPLVISLHTWISRIDGKTGWQDKFKKIWLKRAKKVFACSDALRRRSWPHATVIENPYRDNIFKIDLDVRRDLDFVFLGRLVSDKGASLAIEALNKLYSERKNDDNFKTPTSLTIIGSGPEFESLKNFARELNLENQVVFKGPLQGEKLVQELNKHTFLLVPSLWEEPFGIVVLEGMACGCIPIASDGGGLPDAVGDAGLLFARGNVDSLVLSMKKLMGDRALQLDLRDRATLHLQRHQAEIVAQRYHQVFEKILKKK